VECGAAALVPPHDPGGVRRHGPLRVVVPVTVLRVGHGRGQLSKRCRAVACLVPCAERQHCLTFAESWLGPGLGRVEALLIGHM